MKSDKIFHSKYDAIKWSISNYVSENESYRAMVREMLLSNITIAIQKGFSIIVDGGFGDDRGKYQELAEQFNYQYLSVNLEPPLEVLEQRFNERIESAKQAGSKIAVTTLEGLHRNYQWYLDTNKDLNGLTLDSSQYSPEKLFQIIQEKLNNNTK